jgi:hypothetical protein
MKQLFLLLIAISLSNCNPKDCFDSTGDIIQKEIALADFNKIEVGEEVTLIIKQGEDQKVIIETGENLIDNVTVEVIDGKLFMKDESSCNLSRDYAVTKVYVTAPNIKEIRSNTARNILSDGILGYDNLTLVSEDYSQDALNIGDFKLTVNSTDLSITSNGNSTFEITGNTNLLKIGFYSGSSRFIGNNLISKKVSIIQKSTNDILIYPTQQIVGDIYALGDVISYFHPEIVNVREHYTGKLIFE